MDEMFKERRKFARATIELIVRYKVLDIPQQQLEAKTKDISGGGICLVTREKMKLGTAVAMEIKFSPADNPVIAYGRVVWFNQSKLGPSPAGHLRFDSGIEFEKISDQDRKRIIEKVQAEQGNTKSKGWNIGIATDISHSK